MRIGLLRKVLVHMETRLPCSWDFWDTQRLPATTSGQETTGGSNCAFLLAICWAHSPMVLRNHIEEKIKYLESINISAAYTIIYLQKCLNTLQQRLHLVRWCLWWKQKEKGLQGHQYRQTWLNMVNAPIAGNTVGWHTMGYYCAYLDRDARCVVKDRKIKNEELLLYEPLLMKLGIGVQRETLFYYLIAIYTIWIAFEFFLIFTYAFNQELMN